jgi:hypothetical protein
MAANAAAIGRTFRTSEVLPRAAMHYSLVLAAGGAGGE